jgi:hypothetical protein
VALIFNCRDVACNISTQGLIFPTPDSCTGGFFEDTCTKTNNFAIKPAPTTPEIMMENTQTLDLITAGIAIAILIGGYFMMFTDVFTRKKK